MRVVVLLAIFQGKEARAVAEKAGADPGGGGSWGSGTPPPPPFWGPPNFIKREKTYVRKREWAAF